MAFYPSSINGAEVLHSSTGEIPYSINIDDLHGKYTCGWLNTFNGNYGGNAPFRDDHAILYTFGNAQFVISRLRNVLFRYYDSSTKKWSGWS